jgi:hypothetical protein
MDRGCDLVVGSGVREPAYTYLLRQEFAECGTRPKAFNDHGDDNPEGRPTDGIVDEVAKYERARTPEKTRRGKLKKVKAEDHDRQPCRLRLQVQRH